MNINGKFWTGFAVGYILAMLMLVGGALIAKHVNAQQPVKVDTTIECTVDNTAWGVKAWPVCDTTLDTTWGWWVCIYAFDGRYPYDSLVAINPITGKWWSLPDVRPLIGLSYFPTGRVDQ